MTAFIINKFKIKIMPTTIVIDKILKSRCQVMSIGYKDYLELLKNYVALTMEELQKGQLQVQSQKFKNWASHFCRIQ